MRKRIVASPRGTIQKIKRIKNSMINARDFKSRADSNHKQPTAKDALELFVRNSLGKALFFAYLSEL